MASGLVRRSAVDAEFGLPVVNAAAAPTLPVPAVPLAAGPLPPVPFPALPFPALPPPALPLSAAPVPLTGAVLDGAATDDEVDGVAAGGGGGGLGHGFSYTNWLGAPLQVVVAEGSNVPVSYIQQVPS